MWGNRILISVILYHKMYEFLANSRFSYYKTGLDRNVSRTFHLEFIPLFQYVLNGKNDDK